MGLGSFGNFAKMKIRWQLIFYDAVIYVAVIVFIVSAYGQEASTIRDSLLAVSMTLLCLLVCRTVGGVYSMIIRYGGVHVYMRLFATDLVALLGYFPVKYGLQLEHVGAKIVFVDVQEDCLEMTCPNTCRQNYLRILIW